MGKKKNPLSILNIILTTVILLLILAIVLIIFVVSPMTVRGESMRETFQDGDRIWILKTEKQFKVGDIVVFTRDGKEDNIVKRIIAKEGDTIKFDPKQGYIVNGEVLEEDYIRSDNFEEDYKDYFDGDETLQDQNIKKWLLTSGIRLGKDELFVLGDNRTISLDSHRYGPIKIQDIKGKVL